MNLRARHEHRCACGARWNCANTDCTTDLCDQCEADLYWDARAPEDVQDEQNELRDTADYRCHDDRQQTLTF